MPIFKTVSGMQYERLLCAGFDFSWFWFSIKLISFKFWSVVLLKVCSGLNYQKNRRHFRLARKPFSNQFSIQAWKLQKKSRKPEIVFFDFPVKSGFSSETVSKSWVGLVFSSRSFFSNLVSTNNFFQVRWKKSPTRIFKLTWKQNLVQVFRLQISVSV